MTRPNPQSDGIMHPVMGKRNETPRARNRTCNLFQRSRSGGLGCGLRAPARPRARVPTDGRLEPELAAHRTGDARLRDCTPDIRT